MTRLATIVLATLIFVVSPALAHVPDQAMERGFNPENVYQVGEIDQVNLFNGNLTLTIPLGPTFQVGGGFSYRFALVYNGGLWDYSYDQDCAVNLPPWSWSGHKRDQAPTPCSTVVGPAAQANAGLGWRVSLGELLRPGQLGNRDSGTWLFVSPNGSEHMFFREMHPNFGTPGTGSEFKCQELDTGCYTTDGTYLRLRLLDIDGNQRAIDFPDGRTMVFEKHVTGGLEQYRLHRIHDQFESGGVRQNFLEIDYDEKIDHWVIKDGDDRHHEIEFVPDSGDLEDLVSEVRLASHQTSPSVYRLGFDNPDPGGDDRLTLLPGCSQDDQQQPIWYSLPALWTLTLPDSSVYTFRYHQMPTSQTRCSLVGGLLASAELPTGGRVEWDYDRIYKNPLFICDPSSGSGPNLLNILNNKFGVAERRLFGIDDVAPIGTWKYQQLRPEELEPPISQACDEFPSEVTAVVVHPIGEDGNGTEKYSRVENFFSVYSGGPAGPLGDPTDYGLPYHGDEAEGVVLGDGGDEQHYHLQSRVYECLHDDPLSNAGCSLQRSGYVRYDRSWAGCDPAGDSCFPVNHRVVGEATVFEDDVLSDGTKVHRRADFSCFDGFGNFRRKNLRGNFPNQGQSFSSNQRVVDRRYNPERGVYPAPDSQCVGLSGFSLPDINERWPVGNYDRDAIWQPGNQTTITLFSFDDAGFLRGSRRLKNGGGCATQGCNNQQPGDLVTLRSRDEKGWLTGEFFYGGDANDANGVSLSGWWQNGGSPPAGWEYHFQHDNTFLPNKIESETSFRSAGGDEILRTETVELDKTTRRVLEVKDSADLMTRYTYDLMGRVTEIVPPGEAATILTYNTSVAPVHVELQRVDSGGALLTERYEYDGFGRLARSERSLPGGAGFNAKEITYLANGWKQSESETVLSSTSNPPRTEFRDYDPFGRAQLTIPPDGFNYRTEFDYQGERRTTRTDIIRREDGSLEPTDRRMWHDRLGRLQKVEENSSGSLEPTFYRYDNEDRLLWVQVGSSASTVFQNRTFAYDHRGYLDRECHPELGFHDPGQPSLPSTENCYQHRFDSRGNRLSTTLLRSSGTEPWSFDLEYLYDGAGRLTQVLNDGTRLKEYFYARGDAFGAGGTGRLVQTKRLNRLPLTSPLEVASVFDDVTVTETFHYESTAPRVGGRKIRSSNGRVFEQTFVYDALGSLISETYPNCLFPETCESASPSRVVTRTFDQGRLLRVPEYIDWIAYHPNGMWRRIEHANGVDDHQDLYSSMALPGKLATDGITGPRGDWTTGLIQYDGARNIWRMGDFPDWDRFYYDGAGRLQFAEIEVVEGSGARVARTYDYDIFGNRTSATGPGAIGAVGVHWPSNRLMAANYDQAGNVSSWLHDYLWDPLSKLVRETGPGIDRKMLYTADDERVAVLSGEGENWTLRDFGNRVLRRMRFEGGGWEWEQDYLHRDGGIVAAIKPDDVGGERALHYHLDHLGSTRVITDGTASRVATYKYWPFGEEAWSETTEPDAERVRFTGHERDFGASPETDLDYMHARYYTPWAGKFLSTDPVLGQAELPQSWNRYSYVRNNPIVLRDPTGKTDDELAAIKREIARLTEILEREPLPIGGGPAVHACDGSLCALQHELDTGETGEFITKTAEVMMEGVLGAIGGGVRFGSSMAAKIGQFAFSEFVSSDSARELVTDGSVSLDTVEHDLAVGLASGTGAFIKIAGDTVEDSAVTAMGQLVESTTTAVDTVVDPSEEDAVQ